MYFFIGYISLALDKDNTASFSISKHYPDIQKLASVYINLKIVSKLGHS